MDVGGGVCIAGKICVSREEAGIDVVCSSREMVGARSGILAAAAARSLSRVRVGL
jgi:hypothetical protein